jgi:hypothetical protein
MSTNLDTLPIALQPRDFALLQGLFESRIMTLAHVATLYFDGKTEAAKKRVQKLKTAGFVSERPRRAFEPSALLLGPEAVDVLAEEGFLSRYPRFSREFLKKRAEVSALTVAHELQVMDVKASVCAAMREREQFQIVTFSTWPTLHEFTVTHPQTLADVCLKPDGFLRVHEQEADGSLSEHNFFLEVDRSTEVQEKVASKAQCYREFYANGGFALRSGGEKTAFKEYPFRVLFVFQNAERRNNAAERMLQIDPPVLTQSLLTTLPELVANPLGSIWISPAAYRHAMRGTPFENGYQGNNRPYERQSEREATIAARARLESLLQ